MGLLVLGRLADLLPRPAYPRPEADDGRAAVASLGLCLGPGCGLLTNVYLRRGQVMARATGPVAAMWIIGMGSRLAFGVVALKGGAQDHVPSADPQSSCTPGCPSSTTKLARVWILAPGVVTCLTTRKSVCQRFGVTVTRT